MPVTNCEKSYFLEFAKINTREIFCSYPFVKINTRKIQFFFCSRKKIPAKISTLKVDVFESIKHKIAEKTWDAVEYAKDYIKIKFESKIILPVGKDVNIRMATITTRAIFAQDGKYYPQLFLDDGLYKNIRV